MCPYVRSCTAVPCVVLFISSLHLWFPTFVEIGTYPDAHRTDIKQCNVVLSATPHPPTWIISSKYEQVTPRL